VTRIAAPLAMLAAALLCPAAAAAASPLSATPVKARPAPVNEESPSAAVGELAWVQNTRSHPHLYNVYAQNGGGARFRVNPAGTQGGLGTGIHQQSPRAADHPFPLECRTGIIFVGLDVVMAEHAPISVEFLIRQLARNKTALRVLRIIAFDLREYLAEGGG